MHYNELSAEHQALLSVLESKLRHFKKDATVDASNDVPQEFWSFLQQSESMLLDRQIAGNTSGHAKYGPALYVLNHLIPSSLSRLLAADYGMPPSTLTRQQWEEFSLAGFVGDDGSLYAISKYAVLDPGWFVVLVKYFWYRHIDPSGVHAFVNKQVVVSAPKSSVRIAVIGDWGTGDWKDGKQSACPAQLVIDGITTLNPPPDYILHLGDVYYAGTAGEEKNNLVGMLPQAYKNKVLTLNSNHEMYDGANGYFDVALNNSFTQLQQGCSYFALEGDHWVIVGLDSAYYDKSSLYMKGALALEGEFNDQMEFLKKQARKGKYLILMTHHNGVAYNGLSPNGLLWQQVKECLAGDVPDLWYWGHVHNGIVYGSDCPATNHTASVNGFIPKVRCCGHASIPFGNGSGLHHESQNIPGIEYYAHTPMDASHPTPAQKLRCLNGFAVLDLDSDGVFEQYLEVSNNLPNPKQVWSEKSTFSI